MDMISEIELEIIINHIRRGDPLPDKYKRWVEKSLTEFFFDSHNKQDQGHTETGINQSADEPTQEESLGYLIGVSPVMRNIFNTIKKIAHNNIPVLITDDKGTGKKSVARTLHDLGLSSTGPFILVDCGSFSEFDFDSKIFGQERAAVSTSRSEKRGLIELAQGGTIFFNQIGELALPLQAKLTSFFRDYSITASNNPLPTHIDARIISSSDIDLANAVEQGNFRKDVFFQINTISIKLPMLKERLDDILPLAKAFLDKYSREYNKKTKGLNPGAREALVGHSWPGNVIELENRIKRALVLAEGRKITLLDLGFEEQVLNHYGPISLKEAKENLEKDLLIKALNKHQGNLSKTANELDISRPTLYDLMVKHNIPKS